MYSTSAVWYSTHCSTPDGGIQQQWIRWELGSGNRTDRSGRYIAIVLEGQDSCIEEVIVVHPG